MIVKTFRAPTMHQALCLVRRELGPRAAVLHTREVRSGGLFRWLPWMRKIEVTASADVVVPSRLPPPAARESQPADSARAAETREAATAASKLHGEVRGQLAQLHSLVEDLCRRTRRGAPQEFPDSLYRVYTALIEAEVPEEAARDLIDLLRADPALAGESDPRAHLARLARELKRELPPEGPIALVPGRRRVAALVGPTGVGKTTTLAKLAANFKLRDGRKVGLITVDTYRIAAVEQLRTYADIIELPMHVVSTPREMRRAADALADCELVLIDTAGRSPRDDVQIRELRGFLQAAQADEVHLVLSAVATTATLARTCERFSAAGTTAVILTKLDEASNLGHLLPLLRTSRLPLSYLTDGQNVPDDIAVADRGRLARMVLGLPVDREAQLGPAA